jgi:transcriptional regulator with XRE-family HTH domain
VSTESSSIERQALGRRLRDARKSAKLSQHDVAAEFRCARQTVASWESGNSVPNALQVATMAILYGCSADCLLFGLAPQQAGQLPVGELDSMTPAVRRRLEVLWQVFVRTGAADPLRADAK